MDQVLCTQHGAPCMMKTGTKPGPNLGKCFYVCSVLRDKCAFAKHAPKVTSCACLKHPENITELQYITVGKVSGEKRHYYRCSNAQETGEKWCGFVVLETVGKVVPLGDSQKHNTQSATVPQTSVSVKQSVASAEESTRNKPVLKRLSGNKSNFVSVNDKSKLQELESPDYVKSTDNNHRDRSSLEVPEVISIPDEGSGDCHTSLSERIRNKSGTSPEDVEITTSKPNGVRPKMASLHENTEDGFHSASNTLFTSSVHTTLMSRDDHGLKEKISRELKQKKQVMGTINLSSLPDKGERLRQQVVELENQLSYLSLKVVNNPHLNAEVPKTRTEPSQSGQSSKKQAPPPAPPPPRAPQVYTVYPSKSASSSVQSKTVHVLHQPSISNSKSILKSTVSANPGSGLKQPTLPFKTASGATVQGEKQIIVLDEAGPVPDHVLKQMYGAKPQMMTLYGGRMTKDRLQEVGLVTRDAIESLHKQLERRPAETAEMEDPKGLRVPLMTHQRQALTWLIWREKQTPSGGILADDMGLGKTLTMISLIIKQNQLNPSTAESAKSRKSGQDWISKDKQLEKLDKNIVKSRGTLVICPASLIHQWHREIENRCEEGVLRKVNVYHGPTRESDVFRLADNDVVLTTYNIVSKEVGEDADAKEAERPVGDQSFCKGKKAKDMPNLSRIAWERVILDEAHNIKNHKCKTSISVCRLRAGCRWALTGTPIQNDLIDMYSLLRFLRCSPFDEYQVWKRQVAVNAGTGKARLNTLVKSFLLRRTKDQKGKEGKPLVPLPKKSIIVHELKLSKEEKSAYDKVYSESQSAFKEYLKRHVEKGGDKNGRLSDPGPGSRNPFMDRPAGGGASKAGGGSKGPGTTHILVSLLRLRQCCGHLSLLKHAIEEEVLETEGIELSLVEQMQGLMLGDSKGRAKQNKPAVGPYDISKMSSKIKAVMAELETVRGKSSKGKPLKSVVVSQWTKMLEIAAHHLGKAGFRCSLIQGNIAPHKRMEAVEDFNTNPDGPTVMLLSLRAGGVGLNLIGGCNLFLLDQHWNPALEEQACDRIYRVGQVNDVFIHKFLCTDTVEEKIAELQKRKTDLANDILSGSNASKRKLTLADLRMLFNV